MVVKNSFDQMEVLDKLEGSVELGDNDKEMLMNYKVGSTALDCSIMVTLRRINGTFDVR